MADQQRHQYTALANCPHPRECWTYDNFHDGTYCPICEDIDRLVNHVMDLKAVLHQKAVMVTGGEAIIGGPIGLLEVLGGHVYVQSGETASSIYVEQDDG